MGAASLNARLDCEAFASAHRDTSHYDRSSFVGLAWRPPNKAICCEVYSTGRANLPGSVTERALQASWREMLPDLLAFSTASAQLRLFPEMREVVERTGGGAGGGGGGALQTPDGAAAENPLTGWDDWDDGGGGAGDGECGGVADSDDDIDDAMLGVLGL